MNSSIDLTDKNIMLYAMHEYNSPCLNSIDEFVEDLQHVKFIKRLLSRYVNSGKINAPLVLNRIVSLHNVFRIEALCRILFFYVDEKHYPILKPFLVFLDYLPDTIPKVKGRNINTVAIPMNQDIVNVLRHIR
jgi:hypothetical protein